MTETFVLWLYYEKEESGFHLKGDTELSNIMYSLLF